jgi:hypothetical protein
VSVRAVVSGRGHHGAADQVSVVDHATRRVVEAIGISLLAKAGTESLVAIIDLCDQEWCSGSSESRPAQPTD